MAPYVALVAHGVRAPYGARTILNRIQAESQATSPIGEEILTREEVATWLRVKPRQVERLGLPLLDLGRKTKRYLRRDIVAWLERRRVEHALNHAITLDEDSEERPVRRKRWKQAERRAL